MSTSLALVVIAGSILLFGGIGEIAAIVALYNRNADGNGGVVLAATILLIIALAAGPTLSLLSYKPPQDTDAPKEHRQSP